MCGDKFTVYLDMQGDVVKDVTFQGTGCAISTASASVMTEVLRGKSRQEVDELFESFHELVTGKGGEEVDTEKLGKLAVFAGVSEFPSRVKCAVLAWHTARAALDGTEESITTE